MIPVCAFSVTDADVTGKEYQYIFYGKGGAVRTVYNTFSTHGGWQPQQARPVSIRRGVWTYYTL